MTVYVIIACLICIGTFWGDGAIRNSYSDVPKQKGKLYTAYFWLICVILIIILGLRSDTFSSDYVPYQVVFSTASKTSLSSLPFPTYRYGGVEIGFFAFSRLIALVVGVDHIDIFMLIIAAITIIPAGIVLLKYSKMSFLSLFFLFLVGYYFKAFNSVRSCMVAGLSFLLYDDLINKNLKRYLVKALGLLLFHNTAIFLIPLYFILQIDFLTLKKGSITIFVTVLFATSIQKFVTIYDRLFFDSHYAEVSSKLLSFKGASFGSIVPALAILIFLLAMNVATHNERNEEMIISNGTYLWCVLMMFTLILSILSRFADILCIYPCLLIPEKLYRMGKGEVGNNNRKVLIVAFLIVLFIWMFFILRESPYNPYYTIYEKSNLYFFKR